MDLAPFEKLLAPMGAAGTTAFAFILHRWMRQKSTEEKFVDSNLEVLRTLQLRITELELALKSERDACQGKLDAMGKRLNRMNRTITNLKVLLVKLAPDRAADLQEDDTE